MSHCDASCVTDSDCDALAGTYTCELGRCRADRSGTRTTAAPASPCQRSQLAADQVALLGDSFFAASHEVAADLSSLAVGSGAIQAGASYQDQSSLIDNALALGGEGIKAQYLKSLASGAVRAVVMTGGGADLLLGQCDEPYSSCAPVVNAVSAAAQLFTVMQMNAVAAVVYAYYPDPLDPVLAAKVAALRPLLEQACSDSVVPCHWLDLRATFDGQPAYLSADGMTPSATGSSATAAAIARVMRDACVAQ